jgi:hypothetical protein
MGASGRMTLALEKADGPAPRGVRTAADLRRRPVARVWDGLSCTNLVWPLSRTVKDLPT